MGIEDDLERLLQQQNSAGSQQQQSSSNHNNNQQQQRNTGHLPAYMGQQSFAAMPSFPANHQQQQMARPQQVNQNVPVVKNAMQTVLATFPKDEQLFVLDLFKKMNSRQLDSATFARLLRDRVGIDKFQLVITAIRSSYVPPPSSSNANVSGPFASGAPAAGSQGYLATNRETRSSSNVAQLQALPQQQQNQIAPLQQSSSSSSSSRQKAPAVEAAPREVAVDVNKMDSSLLQDVINYAGVDLKAESELIMKEAERANYRQQQSSAYSLRHQGSAGRQYIDESRKQTFIATGGQLMTLMRRIAKRSSLSQVEGDCDALLALALQQYLKSILEKCIKACRSRVELGRDMWQIELLDGEDATWCVDGEGRRSRIGAVKRPLVWLEKFEKAREARLAIHELNGSVSEEGRTAMVDAGLVEREGVAAPDSAASSAEPTAAADDKMEGITSSSASGSRKKAKTATGPAETGSAAESYWKEKDEQRIRTKLSNAAALQAIGMDKYSWMTAPNATSTSAATAAPTAQKPPTGAAASRGGFALPREDQRKKILKNRKITMSDLLYCATFIPTIKPQLLLKNR